MTTRQRRSRKQEERAAGRLGGRRVAGSGSGWLTKNDVRNEDLSVEIKYTDKQSYTLKLADLRTAERNALMDGGREFAFLIGFGRQRGSSMVIDREYVVISRDYFEGLRDGHPE